MKCKECGQEVVLAAGMVVEFPATYSMGLDYAQKRRGNCLMRGIVPGEWVTQSMNAWKGKADANQVRLIGFDGLDYLRLRTDVMVIHGNIHIDRSIR